MSEEIGSGYFRGLLAGLLVGAAAALLLAPKEGGAFRRDLAKGASKLKDKAADLGGNVTDSARDLKHIGEDLVTNVRSSGSDAADKAADVVDNLQEKAHASKEDLKERAHELVDKV